MRKKFSLGIEVNDDQVLAVMLDRKAKKVRVQTTLLQSPKIRSCLNSLVVVSAVSKDTVMQTQLSVDVHLSDYEIEVAVKKYIAEKIDGEFYSDFYVDGMNKYNDQEMDVNVFYARREIINTLLRPIEDAHLMVNVIEVKENMRLLAEEYLKNHVVDDIDNKYFVALGCAVRGILLDPHAFTL